MPKVPRFFMCVFLKKVQRSNPKSRKMSRVIYMTIDYMKGILIFFLSAISALSFGVESYVSAQPDEQIVIKSNRVTGSVGYEYGGKEVYAEFKNLTGNTVSISWSLSATDRNGNTVEVASGTCTVEPYKTYRTARYPKNFNLSNYNLNWYQN